MCERLKGQKECGMDLIYPLSWRSLSMSLLSIKACGRHDEQFLKETILLWLIKQMQYNLRATQLKREEDGGTNQVHMGYSWEWFQRQSLGGHK